MANYRLKKSEQSYRNEPACGFREEPDTEPDETVFVSKTGLHCHRADCHHMEPETHVPVTFSELDGDRYEPCRKCFTFYTTRGDGGAGQ